MGKLKTSKNNDTPWLSVAGVGRHLGVSKETVYRWLAGRQSNKIPAYKLGKLWKFHKDEIGSWVKSGGAK